MQPFDFSEIPGSIPLLWEGLKLTLAITLVAALLGLLIGTLVAVLRLSKNPVLRFAGSCYVTTFRAVPLIMVLLWFYLLVPQLLRSIPGFGNADIRLPAAFAGFSFFEASYYAEIVRAGIMSVSPGQTLAGQALGFSPGETFRLLILPQALRRMVPILLTQAVILFQDTSLVYVIGLADFFTTAARVGANGSTYPEFILFAGSVYFVISFLGSQYVQRFAP